MAKSKYPSLKSGHRRSKGKYPGRLFTGFIKYSALTALLLGSGYWGVKAYRYITRLPYFEVSTIRIKGNWVLDKSQIRMLANLSYQQNIFDIDTESSKKALEAHPYIKQAHISKRLPDTIQIITEERTRFAMLMLNSGGRFVVDEEGIVLEELSGGRLPNLPIISGASEGLLKPGNRCRTKAVKNGLQILKQLGESRFLGDVSEVNVNNSSSPLFYTLKEGIEVRLGEGEIGQKITQMKIVWRNLNARIKEVDFLDLRYKDMVVVRFKEHRNMV